MKKILLFLITLGYVSLSDAPIMSFVQNEKFAVNSQNTPPKNNTKKLSNEDIHWLTKNIYFESANQKVSGRIAVMMVTLNRVASDKFPNTIKEVVTQGGQERNRCQFSWYCDGKTDKVIDDKTFKEIEDMVHRSLENISKIKDITYGSLYYHATYVKPKWSKKMKKIVQIGDHIFYKEK